MTAAAKLKSRLDSPGIITLPGCHDALSAKMIEQAGFDAAFMSGFAVSAAKLAMPDAGLITYKEMVDQGRDICAAVDIPIIGDGDTGFGNPANVRRSVRGYHDAGFACIMIEDQLYPKRCGYAAGMDVVERDDAFTRVQAAVDEREAIRADGGDILVIGRTDARHPRGLDEALYRVRRFEELGANIAYMEAAQNEDEMRRLCESLTIPTMLAQVDQPGTEILSAKQAEEIGYKLALYGLTVLSSYIKALKANLARIGTDDHPGGDALVSFEELYDYVGFNDYYKMEERYASTD